MDQIVKIQNLVHVTHTDIHHDSRIIKSMGSVAELNEVMVHGFGLGEEKNDQNNRPERFNYCLRTRLILKKIPKPLRLLLLGPIFIFFEYLVVFIYLIAKKKPAVLHAHDYLALAPCWVYSKFSQCQLIYDAHELESQKNGIGRLSSLLVKKFEALTWGRIDGFITVSDSIQSWYFKEYGRKESEIVLNSPVVSTNDDKKIRSFREKFNIPSDKLVAVYVGLFVKGRGIENILSIAKDVGDIHFVFLGDGELKKEIGEAAQRNENISIHPFVEHSLVVSYLKGADIGLCLLENISLSDFYAIPNKLLEYSFSGLFVVGTNFPEMSNVIDGYNLGICLPDKIDEAKDALRKITYNDIERRKRAAEDQLYDLSWQAQASKLRSLYTTFLMNNEAKR